LDRCQQALILMNKSSFKKKVLMPKIEQAKKGKRYLFSKVPFYLLLESPSGKFRAFFATKIPPRQSATFEPWAWNRPGTPWKTTFVAQKHTHSPKR